MWPALGPTVLTAYHVLSTFAYVVAVVVGVVAIAIVACCWDRCVSAWLKLSLALPSCFFFRSRRVLCVVYRPILNLNSLLVVAVSLVAPQGNERETERESDSDPDLEPDSRRRQRRGPVPTHTHTHHTHFAVSLLASLST